MTTKFILATILAAAVATPAVAQAPQGSETSLYCLRVEPELGSRIEKVECHTRGYWAEFDVDVDAEWAREGVTVLG